jgi:hypothetical protein
MNSKWPWSPTATACQLEWMAVIIEDKQAIYNKKQQST